MNHKQKEPVLIKKYANRRLYNTEISSYVTLNDLCIMVKDHEDFIVRDAKTGEDITHLILTQIIFEQELKGYNLLPISFLKQIINFYDDSLRTVLPHYLTTTMEYFSHHQEGFRQYLGDTFTGFSPFKMMEEMTKQNMAFFQNAMTFFTNNNPPSEPTDPSKKRDE